MSLIVIGNGQMLFSCLEIMAKYDSSLIKIVITSDLSNGYNKIQEFCYKENIEFIFADNLNEEIFLERIKQVNVDYILNINSRVLFKSDYFKIAKKGIINFHNSFLPFYRGINVCSWALINQEKEYGVTWHFLSPDAIDAGDIICQKKFLLTHNETAYSLIIKCVTYGIELFNEFYPKIIGIEPLILYKQDITNSSLFLRRDKPKNNGQIDFSEKFDKIYSFVRALDFGFLPNDFLEAYIILGGEHFTVKKINYVEQQDYQKYSLGEIIEINNNGIFVRCLDGIVNISRLEYKGKNIKLDEVIKMNNIYIGEILKVA